MYANFFEEWERIPYHEGFKRPEVEKDSGRLTDIVKAVLKADAEA